MPLRKKYKLKQVLRPQRLECERADMHNDAAGRRMTPPGGAPRGVVGGAYLGYKDSYGVRDDEPPPSERSRPVEHGRWRAADALSDERRECGSDKLAEFLGSRQSVLLLAAVDRLMDTQRAREKRAKDLNTLGHDDGGKKIGRLTARRLFVWCAQSSKAAVLAAIKLPDLGAHVEAETQQCVKRVAYLSVYILAPPLMSDPFLWSSPEGYSLVRRILEPTPVP
ncbi:hypothetical protein B0H11DRAFT_1928955 [Mycena galericulata]|nr:hypothetical protein B0H11DRAFT_1928955 [Mycena galericulata]